MTIKEFEEKLKADSKLMEKFDEAKKALDVKGNSKLYEALSKLASDMGFDVPESEFKLESICEKELSDGELEAVAGGRGGVKCHNDFEDTDCGSNDYCDFIINRYNLKACLYSYDDSYCFTSDVCSSAFMHYNTKCDGEWKEDINPFL